MTVNYDYKQVIVMRKDLNMRKGKLCAQAAHASMAVVLRNLGHPYVEAWLGSRFAKIVVYVNSEDELYELDQAALEAGLLTESIVDSGFTEFNNVPTYTCLAIGPAPIAEIDEVTGHLPLL